MARKRMFDLEIIDTDDFLDLPISSQNLYFHYGMRADDDGFISNPKKVMNSVKSTIDDFKILITKKYIIPFESGVIAIRHWKMNNYIRKDRYRPTVYINELSMLFCDENEIYFLESERKKGVVYHMATIGIPSIDKYSIDNKNIIKTIEAEFARLLSPIEIETINSWQSPDELILLALKEATTSNNLAIKYIDRILFNWQKKGIRTRNEAEKYIADFRNKKNKKRENGLPNGNINDIGASYYNKL